MSLVIVSLVLSAIRGHRMRVVALEIGVDLDLPLVAAFDLDITDLDCFLK